MAISRKDRKRIRDLHARMGSSNDGERNAAWHKLDALLKRLGKTWNDLPKLLHDETTASASQSDPRDTVPSEHPFDTYTPFETVRGMLEKYVMLEPHEYVAVTLWIIHTHVYDRFMVKPRLLLTSPVRNCGKTTLLDVISRLVARAEKTDSITAPAIMHIVHQAKRTLLLDEADNLEMSVKAVLRAVLNSGYRKGGTRTLMVKGMPQRFNVFAPIALASIGSLPLPLMSRSHVIRMRRHDGAQSLRRFDATDTADLDIVYQHIRHFSGHVQLNPDPEMPAELRGRQADNWRPLLAIAVVCGPACFALACDAAITFARTDRDEDVAVTLLLHIREVFDARPVDRIASKLLIDHLLEHNEMWSEFRGVHGNENPRKLTQGALAALLRPFGIRPRKFWPPHRDATTKSYRGYFRSDFEAAWRSYCDAAAHRHSRDNSGHYGEIGYGVSPCSRPRRRCRQGREVQFKLFGPYTLNPPRTRCCSISYSRRRTTRRCSTRPMRRILSTGLSKQSSPCCASVPKRRSSFRRMAGASSLQTCGNEHARNWPS
jgi:hypothetical protein